jgi:hypothetical protein
MVLYHKQSRINFEQQLDQYQNLFHRQDHITKYKNVQQLFEDELPIVKQFQKTIFTKVNLP